MIYVAGGIPAGTRHVQKRLISLFGSVGSCWKKAQNELNNQIGTHWTGSVYMDLDIGLIWKRSLNLGLDVDVSWQQAGPVDVDLDVIWAKATQLDQAAEIVFGKAGRVDRDSLLPWSSTLALDMALSVEWKQLACVDIETEIPWVKTTALDVYRYTPWVNGHGNTVETEIVKNFKLPWIAAARIIMTKQNVTFKRVYDDESVRLLTGSFGIDDDSWCYTFSGVVPSREDLEKVMPGALGGGEVEVELSINGYTGRFIVSSFSENHSIGKNTYSIEGKSTGAVLGDPYCIRQTKTYTATNALQIVASELSFYGWTVDWQLLGNTWNIDGEFSVVDKTVIEIISEIAQAVGGIVQCDLLEKKLILKSRYPISPKNYQSSAPDEYIISGILEISGSYVAAPLYNKVIVSGKETGVIVAVQREGTTGDMAAPEIVDPLLTAQAINIERGRAYLDQTGYHRTDYELLLPLPESGSDQRPKLLRVCDLVEVKDKNETWRGRVASVEVGFSQAKTRQRITVERYHV